MQYFVDNGIKIKEIECGMSHNLALDTKGNVYGWGYNYWGQCGDGSRMNVLEPKKIDFKGMKVKVIKCGSNHSYCKTNDGRNWLWGRNENNECLVLNDKRKRRKIPFCIDRVIEKKCNGQRIKDVFLGYNNTKILTF